MKSVRLLVCSMLALSSASVFAGNATPAPDASAGSGEKLNLALKGRGFSPEQGRLKPATDTSNLVLKDEVLKNVSQDKVSVYRELDELRSENAILAEKLKNAELKAKIIASKDGGKAGDLPPPSPYGSFAQSPGMSQGMGAARQTLPMVQMISGSGGEVSARLTLPNGGQQMVRVGSIVPKFGTVKSISLNEVLLLDKSGYVALPFAPEQNAGTSSLLSSSPPGAAGPMGLGGNPFAAGGIGSPVRMGMP